ncbi:MAG: hypothetical protein FWD43_06045 [Coriobacteriia bacterium]|nr:hypothetical protein [Coriobacteriia bacterium]
MDELKITPVAKQVIPRYPDQYSTQLDSLLLENKPLRWMKAPVTGAVLTAVVALGLAGCSPSVGATTMGDPQPLPTTLTDTPHVLPNIPVDGSIQTPFFEHGRGIGSYGCVSITAPVFLSEADAYSIISTEFKRLDLTVQRGGPTVVDIQVPAVDPSYPGGSVGTTNGDLVFDFSVKDKNIVMEYVSYQDMEMWEAHGSYSTVYRYDYIEAAKTLNDSLNASYPQNIHGVFYEPAELGFKINDSETPEREIIMYSSEETRQRAQDELRAQVKDFIEWLIAQGVI